MSHLYRSLDLKYDTLSRPSLVYLEYLYPYSPISTLIFLFTRLLLRSQLAGEIFARCNQSCAVT